MSEMSLGLTAAAYGQTNAEPKRQFFDVSVLKLVVMSIVTFGFYELYWFYRHWRMAKDRGEDVTPWARALFAVFFVYPLFKNVRQAGRAASVDAAANAGGLAALFILLQISWRLPDPFWLAAFATVVPLAIVQRDIGRIHRAMGLDPGINSRFTGKNYLAIVIGGLLVLLILVGLALPDPALVP
jgi:hypothetical protein